MIFNMSGGGAASLNFDVKAYAVLPETGKENEIAVITETPITEWVMSSTEPTPAEGMVWVALGQSGPVSFNALKKQGIILCPLNAKQYVSEAWVSKTAKIYQNGVWVDWVTYIFNAGVINTDLVGPINGVSLSDSVLRYDRAVTSGENKTYTTTAAINLTNYTKMGIKFLTEGYSGSKRTFRLVVTAGAKNGAYVTTNGLEAYSQKTSGFVAMQEETLELDVSELNDSYYVGVAFGVASGEGAQRATAYNITSWWLE